MVPTSACCLPRGWWSGPIYRKKPVFWGPLVTPVSFQCFGCREQGLVGRKDGERDGAGGKGATCRPRVRAGAQLNYLFSDGSWEGLAAGAGRKEEGRRERDRKRVRPVVGRERLLELTGDAEAPGPTTQGLESPCSVSRGRGDFAGSAARAGTTFARCGPRRCPSHGAESALLGPVQPLALCRCPNRTVISACDGDPCHVAGRTEAEFLLNAGWPPSRVS
jgi:hypothetical protein